MSAEFDDGFERIKKRIDMMTFPDVWGRGALFAFSGNGVSYVLVKETVRERLVFAFSRGKDLESVQKQGQDALKLDISALIAEKMNYFKHVPIGDNISSLRQKTLAKVFSVMKSQVYSPEGIFQQRWTADITIVRRSPENCGKSARSRRFFLCLQAYVRKNRRLV